MIEKLARDIHDASPDTRREAFAAAAPLFKAAQDREAFCRLLGFADAAEYRRKRDNLLATFRMRKFHSRAREAGFGPAHLLVHAADRETLRRFSEKLNAARLRSQRG